MTGKPSDLSDLNALAIEACDMWQEHLSNLANDPAARAELSRFLEPQRRLFADWATMMQQGMKGAASHDTKPKSPEASAQGDAPTTDTSFVKPASESPGASAKGEATSSGGAAHGDDPLRAAQLALRLAELEKRVIELEARLAEPKPGAARRTQRTSS